MNEHGIKKLINPDILAKNIEHNKDEYGGAVVKVAIKVMQYLDTFEGEFNLGYSPDMSTTHGIMCHVDDEGITGFMAGCARNIISMCRWIQRS